MTGGRCRLGYAIGLMSLTLKAPSHILQWAPQFAREMVKSSVGGGVYALSKMVDHTLLKDGAAGLEDCESLPTHLATKKMVAEKYLARHFPGIQRALEQVRLENAYWPPGTENPADGLNKVRSNMAPLLGLLESGRSNPE